LEEIIALSGQCFFFLYIYIVETTLPAETTHLFKQLFHTFISEWPFWVVYETKLVQMRVVPNLSKTITVWAFDYEVNSAIKW